MRSAPRPARITVLHVLPNIVSPIIVRITIGMGFTILTAAALGFLGWGRRRRRRSGDVRSPKVARVSCPTRGGTRLRRDWRSSSSCMGFNMLGDGLRDVLDPRLRRAADGRDD